MFEINIYNFIGIQKLVLAGRMGEAIDTTQQIYPGLLERNLNLLFMLKCRQFIEMVNGTDTEVRGPAIRSPKSRHGSGSNRSSPSMSPVHLSNSYSQKNTPIGSRGNSPNRPIGVKGHSSGSNSQTVQNSSGVSSNNVTNNSDLKTISEEQQMNAANLAINGSTDSRLIEDDDVEMIDGILPEGKVVANGNSEGTYMNGCSGHHECKSEEMGE